MATEESGNENGSDPGPEVIELRRRVVALEIDRRNLGRDIAEVKGIVLRTHALVETSAARVARLDKEREVQADQILAVRNEIAELRGRLRNVDDTGQHTALVVGEAVEAAVRASRSEIKEETPSASPESIRRRGISWRPKTKKEWASVLAIALASLAAIAGAAQQLVSMLASR